MCTGHPARIHSLSRAKPRRQVDRSAAAQTGPHTAGYYSEFHVSVLIAPMVQTAPLARAAKPW